ncbi:MAG: SGNH/GDSL hydrolase family protein [Pirellulales bacterium]|nr:SGNH/GDSL hydrolase family protein [Pirellulales bacterium]
MSSAKSRILVLVICTLCVFIASSRARADVILTLDSGQSMNIAAIGTSLTDKVFNQNHFGGPGWFEQVGMWLQTNYPGQVTLSNRAVGASASAYNPPGYPATGPQDGMSQLNDVLTHDNPDAIFLEFAINDAYTVYGISLTQAKANLQTMINTIRTWGVNHGKTVDIVVLSMNDCYNSRPDLEDYYQGYGEVAAANASDHMLFVDNYPLWKNLHDTNLPQWQTFIADGVHPSPLGSANITVQEVKRALLEKAIPEPNSIVLLSMAVLTLAITRFGRRSHIPHSR